MLRRCQTIPNAKFHVLSVWDFLRLDIAPDATPVNMTGKQVFASANMQIKEVAEVFAPHILQLTDQDVEAAAAAVGRYQTWLHKVTADSQVEGSALQQKLKGASHKQRAFLHQGDLPSRCCDATDYTDEWLNDRQRAVRVYYVCMGGHATDKCGHVNRGDAWERLHSDHRAKETALALQDLVEPLHTDIRRDDRIAGQQQSQPLARAISSS